MRFSCLNTCVCTFYAGRKTQEFGEIGNNRRFGVKAGISGTAGLFALMPCRSLLWSRLPFLTGAEMYGSSDRRALESRNSGSFISCGSV